MPYKRRYKRRYNRRRKKYSRKKSTNLASKVDQLGKIVARQTDRRWLDHTNTSVQIPITGTVFDVFALSTITGGDLYNQRQGNHITIKSLQFKGQIFNAAVTDSYNIVRLMLIKIDKYRGTMPVIGDILQGDSIPPLGDPSHLSPYKKNSNFKYQVLWSKQVITELSSVAGTYPTMRCIEFTHSFGKLGLVTTYENDAAAPPITNGIFLACISDSGAVPHPVLACTTRVNYIG